MARTEAAPPEEGAAASGRKPSFAEVWTQIQAKNGEKPAKPREIKKTLGKDDFMKLMVTQMRNQDPTSPFKAEQFASELAQYSALEQLQNVNQALGKMATQNQPIERLAMTNLIGKRVTVDRQKFPHVQGSETPIGFHLPSDASEVTVQILSEHGETVYKKELGALKTGENSIAWDGAMSNSLPAPSGDYLLRIDAKDQAGKPIVLNTRTQAKVVGLSFEGGEAQFLVGDIRKPEKVSLRNIIRIDETAGDSAPGAIAPGAITMDQAVKASGALGTPVPGASTAPLAALAHPSEPKGELAAMPPVAPAAPPERAAVPAAPPVAHFPKQDDKGFPNGLTEERR